MKTKKTFGTTVLVYIMFCVSMCACTGLSALSSSKNSISQQVYFYIPVSFWPNADAIEHCLSKPMYRNAGVQLLHSPSGYHVSMGTYSMPSKAAANDVAFRVQRLVRNKFSKFTAQVKNKRDGVTIFGTFVVIELKTDKKKANNHEKLFHIIHDKITKLILASGGTQLGFLEFRPHCSIASVLDPLAPNFLTIRKKLLKDLIDPVSKVHLVVNPRILQYRVTAEVS